MHKPSYELLDKIYLQQMSWTEQTRKFLYRKMNLFHSKNILEIGCGTGRIMKEINRINPKINVVGVDIDYNVLDYTIKNREILPLFNASGVQLPFFNNFFDITMCNWLLLWLENPFPVLQEMVRVTREGGWITCLAEPDYGGRLDFPLVNSIKNLLLESLPAPDPHIGRKLHYLFSKLDLKAKVGLQSSVLHGEDARNLYDFELQILSDLLPNQESKLKKLKQQLYSLPPSQLFSFMPVFYAIAQK
ncbi:MAG: class I SAM-dependent methyltransferase [Candidatus Hodarchaeales archaeon]